MGNSVSLVQAEYSTIKDSITESINLANFKIDGKIKSVIIKPNLCYYWGSSTGYTTDPRLVAGVIDYLREQCDEDITIKVAEADATAMRTKMAFLVLGYEKLAQEKKVELFNLSEDEIIHEKVTVNGREIAFQIPQAMLKADLLVNVPKLKVMRETQMTCAFKNIFGCIASKAKIAYHPFLNEAIVGINKIIRPHLTIVDGIIALGRVPAKLGLIMAGTDPFSIDWVASQIMGYNPSRIKFLQIAMKEKVGNSQDISIKGENIEKFKKVFPRLNFIDSKSCWNLQLKLISLYHKITKDIIPPVLESLTD